MHRLEVVLRHAVGWLLALLWWRPWRNPAPLLKSAKRVVIVRIDNRVGEALLTTPLVQALAATHEVHLVVHPKCVRVLEGLPGLAGLHGFERRSLARTGELERLCDGAVVVNAASWVEYSGTPALLSRRLGRRACVIGPAVGPAKRLMDVAVSPKPGTRNEVEQRLHLLSPLLSEPRGALAFRPPKTSPAVEALLGAHARLVVLNPGGRLDERRAPPEVFAKVAAAVQREGSTALVTWGPGEEDLARQVASESGGLLAPPTTLDELAALMAKARAVVCNNTGPMHLSVAVGAPTIGLFWKMPVDQWGHPRPPHHMLDLTNEPSVEAMVEKVRAALPSLADR